MNEYVYVIWSFEHNAWWAPNRQGYVTDLAKAGRYNAVDAGQIVTNSIWLDEVAVLMCIAEERGAPMCHPYSGGDG